MCEENNYRISNQFSDLLIVFGNYNFSVGSSRFILSTMFSLLFYFYSLYNNVLFHAFLLFLTSCYFYLDLAECHIYPELIIGLFRTPATQGVGTE